VTPLADKLTEAFDQATEQRFWSQFSDDELWDLHTLLWAWQQDAQHEWIRRRMEREKKA
jgi:hypothetical protein